jgi:Terminase large subunit, T4likevirus-type, N-terminal
MPEGLLVQLDKLAAGTAEDPLERAWGRLRKSLFKRQAEVHDCNSAYICLCCSRRAGKTQLIIRWLLMEAFRVPASEVLYLATTAKSAKEIVWDGPQGIPAIIRKLGLEQYCELNETKSTVTFCNGTVLHVSGAETKNDAARWQGHAYALVVLDETQDWREEILTYTVRTVLAPALMDFGGKLLMAGVPADLCAGLFYEASTGDGPQGTGWTRFHWTCFDNPKLPNAKEWVEEELKRTGEVETNPGPQRSYWGRWVRDPNAQLFQYRVGFNDFDELPTGDDRGRPINWQYVLGIDAGWVDLTTFILLAWSPQTPNVYVLEARGGQKMLDTEIAATIQGYRIRFGMSVRLVADAGAQAKGRWENFQAVHGIAIEPAVKPEKAATIRALNTQMRLGHIKFKAAACKPLTDQLQALGVDPKTGIERVGQACDYADGFLYGWRWTFSHVYQQPKETPTASEQLILDAKEAEERTKRQFGLGSNVDDQIAQELQSIDDIIMPADGLDF